MAVEAPVSKFKKNNFKIYIVMCLVVAIWFAYDGYFNQKFISKHTDEQGQPDSTLVFNRKAPPFFVGAAILLTMYLLVLHSRKIVADEKELVIHGKERIAYDAIEAVDKTHFDAKGFFRLTYRDSRGRTVHRKISDRSYDNLGPLLEHIISKIQ